MHSFDLLIKNGFVIDGTNRPGKKLDLGIKGDTIVFSGKDLSLQAKKTIDANGLTVVPGFIDIHGHSDYNIILGKQANSKIKQGVTTEVIGNCGFAAFPLKDKCLAHIKELYPELSIDWQTLKEYQEKIIKNGTTINLVPLLGHGNLRASIVGYDNISLSTEDLLKTEKLVHQAMQEGAFGFSTGLIYPPGVYASIEELTHIAKIVAEYKGIYTTHMRSEGNRLIEAILEAITVCKNAKIPLQISHFKACAKRNWPKLEEAFNLIESNRDAGLDITCDRYPYTASSTELDSLLPHWTYKGGNEQELARLKDKNIREKIKKEIADDIQEDPEYWQKVMISAVTNPDNYPLEGKTIAEISAGRKEDPIETLFDILIEEKLKVSGIFFSMNEDNLNKIYRKNYVMIGSDSSLRYPEAHFGKSHPRAFGTFPRVIYRYKDTLPLENLIYKMTGFPAQRLNLKKRGVIKKDAYADIVIFDLEKIKDLATYDNPHQYPEGIKTVIVNGTIVVEENTLHYQFPGRVLKNQEDN